MDQPRVHDASERPMGGDEDAGASDLTEQVDSMLDDSAADPPATATPMSAESAAPPPSINDRIVSLIRKHLPVSAEDPLYKTIFKDVLTSHRYPEYSGALVHWALWMAGVRLPTVICRNEEGTEYTPDAFAVKLTMSPNFVRFHPSEGRAPAPGDVLFLSNGPPETEMLAIFMGVDGNHWELAAVSPTTMIAEFTREQLEHRRLGSRVLIGWLPVRVLQQETSAQ
jgi:hypothetical protein